MSARTVTGSRRKLRREEKKEKEPLDNLSEMYIIQTELY